MFIEKNYDEHSTQARVLNFRINIISINMPTLCFLLFSIHYTRKIGAGCLLLPSALADGLFETPKAGL